MKITHYMILGIEENAKSSEIREAYQYSMAIWRPNSVAMWITADKLPLCQELAERITAAYEILSDENKREQYDRQLEQYRTESVTCFEQEIQNDDSFSEQWNELKKARQNYLEDLKKKSENNDNLIKSEFPSVVQRSDMKKENIITPGCDTAKTSLLSANGLEVVYRVVHAVVEDKKSFWCGVHLKFKSPELADAFRELFDTSVAERQINLCSYLGRNNILCVDVVFNSELYFATDIVFNDTYGQALLDELAKHVDLSQVEKPLVRMSSYSPINKLEKSEDTEKQQGQTAKTSLLSAKGLEVVYRTVDITSHQKTRFWCGVHLKFENAELAGDFKELFDETIAETQINLDYCLGKYNILSVNVLINTGLYIATRNIYDDSYGQTLLDELAKHVDLSRIDKPLVSAVTYKPFSKMEEKPEDNEKLLDQASLPSRQLAPVIQHKDVKKENKVLPVSPFFNTAKASRLPAKGLEVVYRVVDKALGSKAEFWGSVHLKFENAQFAEDFKKLFDQSAKERELDLFIYPGKNNILYTEVWGTSKLYEAIRKVSDDSHGQKILDELSKYVDLSRIDKPLVSAKEYCPINNRMH